MKMLRNTTVAAAMALSACGGAGGSEGQQVAVYKYFGSVQCTGGGITLASLESQLANAGVRVMAAGCGMDGNAYAAVCGGADGRIGILDIDARHAQLATSLGFAPLATLPAALRIPCSQ